MRKQVPSNREGTPEKLTFSITADPLDDTRDVHAGQGEGADSELKKASNFVQTRRLARGFTITVSPPIADYAEPCYTPHETAQEPSASFSSGAESLNDETPHDDFFPRKKPIHSLDDHLAPDELLPAVRLDHSVSRLPSLEDMLADEELKKILKPSPVHAEIQQMILVDSDQSKYENLLSLVRKSFEDTTWRLAAAQDQGVIDTLILLARQRLTSVRNPHITPGSDFMVRSSKSFSSSGSRSFSSKLHTLTSAEMTPSLLEKPVAVPDLDTDELIIRSVTHLAVLSAVVRLLRNLSVDCPSAQTYIHDHRIIDLLVEHTDLILEIIYYLQDLKPGGATEEPVQMGMFTFQLQKSSECPKWAAEEVKEFMRVLFQFIINVASGHPKIQGHVLQSLFPENIFNAILLCEDLGILYSLLHCLISQQTTHKLLHSFVRDPKGIKTLYCLFATTSVHSAKNASLNASADWMEPAVGFINNLIYRRVDQSQRRSFGILKQIITEFNSVDPQKYLLTASATLKHAASIKNPPHFSGLYSNRCLDHSIPEEWAEHVVHRVRDLARVPKTQVIHTMIEITLQAFYKKVALKDYTGTEDFDHAALVTVLLAPKHCFYLLLKLICGFPCTPQGSVAQTAGNAIPVKATDFEADPNDPQKSLSDSSAQAMNTMDLIKLAFVIFAFEVQCTGRSHNPGKEDKLEPKQQTAHLLSSTISKVKQTLVAQRHVTSASDCVAFLHALKVLGGSVSSCSPKTDGLKECIDQLINHLNSDAVSATAFSKSFLMQAIEDLKRHQIFP